MPNGGLAVLLALSIATITWGQSSADLSAKYRPITSFQVRPNVVMTPKYAANGQVCEMVLEKRQETGAGMDFGVSFSEKEVKALVDELVPEAERGGNLTKPLNTTVDGGFMITEYNYENVLVHVYGTIRPAPAGDRVITIAWPKRTCSETQRAGTNDTLDQETGGLRSFWGCWVVKEVLPTTGVSGLSKEQVDAIIGRRLVFGKSCARSGDAVAPSPAYSTSILSDRDFFSLGYVSLGQIGVKDSKVVRVQLTKPEFSDFEFVGDDVFLRENDLVIEVENAYFVAERAKADGAACTCEKASNVTQGSAPYRACNQKAETQMEMNACASQEAARIDAELDEVYRKLLSQAANRPEAVEKIKAAERAWIGYRDAYMDAMYPAQDKQAEYGSIYPLEADLLRAKLTQRHITALKELLQQYSGAERSGNRSASNPSNATGQDAM